MHAGQWESMSSLGETGSGAEHVGQATVRGACSEYDRLEDAVRNLDDDDLAQVPIHLLNVDSHLDFPVD